MKKLEGDAIQAELGTVGSVVSTLSPFAKAIVPGVLGILAALVNWLVTGAFDSVSIITAVGGLVTAVLVYEVPNRPRPQLLASGVAGSALVAGASGTAVSAVTPQGPTTGTSAPPSA